MTTASIGTKLGLRKITARIGAEVTGVSPSLELDPDTVTAVRAALSEHKALVFRGIDVDDDGQQRFARYFGPLTSAHPAAARRAASRGPPPPGGGTQVPHRRRAPPLSAGASGGFGGPPAGGAHQCL